MQLLTNNSLTPSGARFRAMSLKIDLSERASTISATLVGNSPPAVGRWLTTDEGPAAGMVWRIRNVDDTHTGNGLYSFTAEHIVNVLKDTLLNDKVTAADMAGKAGATTCTAKQAAQYILKKCAAFTLGTFSFDVSNPYEFNGDSLFGALETVTGSLDGAYWSIDTSVYPFKLNVLKLSDDVDSEMRLNRNITGPVKISYDRTGMFTAICPVGKNNLKLPEKWLTKNTATWGRIEHTETDQSMDTVAKLRTWGTERLNNHCTPTTTITVQGLDLSEATREPLDKIRINRVCRIPLDNGNTIIAEKVNKMTWPDWVKEPEAVTVVLCNQEADVASIIKQMARSGSGGRGGRTAAKNAEEDHAWFEDTTEHVSMVAEAIIGKSPDGVDWKRVSEITVNGDGIVQTVKVMEGDILKHSTSIEQNEKKIGLVVETSNGKDRIRAGEICMAINDDGSSQAVIRADKIYLLGETIAEKVSADFIKSRIATIPVLNTRSLSATGTISCTGYNYAQEYVLGSATGGAGNKYVSNAIEQLQFVTSGTTVTLQKKDFKDSSWVNVGSFERATALSGAWSGRKITVSANASNVPDLVNEIRAESSWSGRTVTVKVYAYTATGQLIGDTGCYASETYNLPKTAISLTRQKRTYEPTTDGTLSAITSNGWYELEVTAAGVSKTWKVEVNG